MATEKKADKERSVEERLKALYQLQTLLSEIDRIKIVRGELPDEVKDLEDELIMYQTRIQKYKDEIAELKSFINDKKGDIATRELKIANYDAQIDNVQNNREYTFLKKEKEFEELEIQLSNKKIAEAQARMAEKEADVARCEEELTDGAHILEEKKQELAEIISETRVEEDRLREEAKTIENDIDDQRTLAAFKRIRKSARNGLGLVTVQRNACGGCFNRIPAQRQLEIRMHKKVIVCEYCGRILIDSALVEPESQVQEPEAPAKKSSSRAKKTKE